MSALFEHPAPRWFSIPAQRPFLDDLAAGLLTALPEPEALAGAVVFTPTRRGARALAEAFVGAAGGRAVLLPQSSSRSRGIGVDIIVVVVAAEAQSAEAVTVAAGVR